jgi:hypothetical protein
VLWIEWSVVSLLSWGPRFDSRLVCVEFVEGNVGMGQVFAVCTFVFLPSLPFHHCSIPILLPPILYNVFLPVLQFSPVSTIPPLLHTHPSIYHPCCIMFFSQYFSFPLSVSFHHCSILIIHLPPIVYNLSNWQHPKATNWKFFFSLPNMIAGICTVSRTSLWSLCYELTGLLSQNVSQVSCLMKILLFAVLGTLNKLYLCIAGHHCWEAISTQSAASTNDHHPEVCAAGTSW